MTEIDRRRQPAFGMDTIERSIRGGRNDRVNLAERLIFPTNGDRILPEVYGTLANILTGLSQIPRQRQKDQSLFVRHYGELLDEIFSQQRGNQIFHLLPRIWVDDLGDLEAVNGYVARMKQTLDRTKPSIRNDLERASTGFRLLRKSIVGVDINGRELTEGKSTREQFAEQYVQLKTESTRWMAWRSELGTIKSGTDLSRRESLLKWVLSEPEAPNIQVEVIKSKRYGGLTLENLIAEAHADPHSEAFFSKMTRYFSDLLLDDDRKNLFQMKKIVLVSLLMNITTFDGTESTDYPNARFLSAINFWHQRLWSEIGSLGSQTGPLMDFQSSERIVALFNNLSSYASSNEENTQDSEEARGARRASLGVFFMSLHECLFSPLTIDHAAATQDIGSITGYPKRAYDWFAASSERSYRNIMLDEALRAYAKAVTIPAIMRGINVLNESPNSNQFGVLVNGILAGDGLGFQSRFSEYYRQTMEEVLAGAYPETSLTQWNGKIQDIADRSADIHRELLDSQIHYLPTSEREDTITFPDESIPSYMGFESASFINAGSDTDWDIEFELQLKSTDRYFRGRITPTGIEIEPRMNGGYEGFGEFAKLIAITAFHELAVQDPAAVESMSIPPSLLPVEPNSQPQEGEEGEGDETKRRKAYARQLPRRRANQSTTPRIISGSDLIRRLEPRYETIRSLSPHPRRNHGFEDYERALIAYNQARADGVAGAELAELAEVVHQARKRTWKTSSGKKQSFPTGFEVRVIEYPFREELKPDDDGRDYSHTWAHARRVEGQTPEDRLFTLRRQSGSGLLRLDQYILDVFGQQEDFAN